MIDTDLYNNFRRLKEWNGDSDIEDLIKYNTTGLGVKRCIEELEKDVYLRVHPILILFAKRGFRHVDVIRYGFSETVDNVSACMSKVISQLRELGLIESVEENSNYENLWYSSDKMEEYNLDWLNTNINENYTYGNAITKIIKSEDSKQATNLQLFVYLFFVTTYWYREVRHHITHGSMIDRYNFFVYFYKQCIDIDMFDVIKLGDDIDLRVELLYQKYDEFNTKERECKEIVMLDGHGCFYRKFLSAVSSRVMDSKVDYPLISVNNLSINVYDIVFRNHLWQSYIMINHDHRENISYRPVLSEDVYNSIIENNGVIYLNYVNNNFNEDELKEFVRHFKTPEDKRRLVVSFVLDVECLYSLVPFFEGDVGMVKLNSDRNDSITFYLP